METNQQNNLDTSFVEAGNTVNLNKLEDGLFSIAAQTIIKTGQLRDVRVAPKKSLENDVARYLTTEFILHSDDKDTIFIWDHSEGMFKDGENIIKAHVHSLMPFIATIRFHSEVLEKVRNETRAMPEQIDPPNLILLRNGIYNLSKKEFIPTGTPEFQEYIRKYLFTARIEAEYNPEITECPTIDAFLQQVVRPEDVPLLYEIAGYCLMNGYPIHALFIMHGSGANGKSTYLTLIQKFLGERNVSNVSLQGLSEDRFASALLYGKRANIFADLPKEGVKEFGLIKALTGGDAITAQGKFQKLFSFVNSAKLIFACNQIPAVYDETDALYRRLIIVDFPNKFEGPQADTKLIEKLTDPKEISGLLFKSLEALYKVNTEGFSYAKTKEERKELMIMKSDSVRAFVEKNVDRGDATTEVSKDDIFDIYLKFCEKHKLVRVDTNIFFKKFKKWVQYDFREVRKIVRGRNTRMIIGLEIKDCAIETSQGKLFEIEVKRADDNFLARYRAQNPVLGNELDEIADENPEYRELIEKLKGD